MLNQPISLLHTASFHCHLFFNVNHCFRALPTPPWNHYSHWSNDCTDMYFFVWPSSTFLCYRTLLKEGSALHSSGWHIQHWYRAPALVLMNSTGFMWYCIQLILDKLWDLTSPAAHDVKGKGKAAQDDIEDRSIKQRIYAQRHTPQKGIWLILDTVSRMSMSLCWRWEEKNSWDTSQLGDMMNVMSHITTPLFSQPPRNTMSAHHDH